MTKTRVTVAALLVGSISGGVVAGAPPVLDTPRVLRAVAPGYPRTAADVTVLGYVLVDVEVDSTGSVTTAHVVRTPPLLHQEPVRAAALWRFEPAPDKPTRTVRLAFVFDLVAEPQNETELYPRFAPPYLVEVRAQCKRRCETLEQIRATAFMGLER